MLSGSITNLSRGHHFVPTSTKRFVSARTTGIVPTVTGVATNDLKRITTNFTNDSYFSRAQIDRHHIRFNQGRLWGSLAVSNLKFFWTRPSMFRSS